jgi:hypothetical protein
MDAAPPPRPHATISVGAVALIPPALATVTSEIALPNRFSLAISSGLGVRALAGQGTTAAGHAMLAPRWYVAGDFETGLHVGWAVDYARAVQGPLAGDLLPPPGFSTGPLVGLKERLPWHLSAAGEVVLMHDIWVPREQGRVPWVSFGGDLQLGVTF